MFAPIVILQEFAEDKLKCKINLLTNKDIPTTNIVDEKFFLSGKTFRMHGLEDTFPF